VVQYRTRRYESEMRYCSTRCRPVSAPVKAQWPPKVYGRRCAVRSGCLDCNTRQSVGRCNRHGSKRRQLLNQLGRRINWLLPRACRNCNAAFNRFDQGTVCDACYKKSHSIEKANRRARIKAGGVQDQGICHQELYRIFNGTCQICGNKTQSPEVWIGWDGKTAMTYAPTVDHIIPLSKAGTHTWNNVQLAHLLCNSFKNDA
jgi:5-methylcytosine-specific restriction endonuclease McrA